MIERDVLLRQVSDMVRALAAVVAGKRAGQHDEAQQELADGVERALGVTLVDLRRMSEAEVQALVTEDGLVSAEKAVALADLLREDEDPAGRTRARWLYEWARDAGGPVPFDVEDRIADLADDEPA